VIVAPTSATALLKGGRLDARYFASPAVRIRTALADSDDADLRRIGGLQGYATVSAPGRFKRTYAVAGEDFVPYLRPYDVFEFLPPEADRLSRTRTENLDDYLIRAGDLLQTCSGRNLGPLTIADSYLSQFALSHDMIRIRIDNEQDRFYTLAFLRTPTGQHLLRGDLAGSVIDHITVDQVSAIHVPFIASVHRAVVDRMREATELRQEARDRLSKLVEEFAASLPPMPDLGQLRDGWTHRAASLRGRLDAAFHDPAVRAVRSDLEDVGGVAVGSVARTFIPGRYKRYYVTPEHGKPIVSGRQLLQAWPVNLSFIAERSFDSSVYALREGMVAFGAEGRAEERIAQPALITEDRAGWLANNHVMRVDPNPGVNSGWLYLAFATPQVQAQVKACSSGSVVDAVNPADLNRVVLPPVDTERGDEALRCWQDFSRAGVLEAEAVQQLETTIAMLGSSSGRLAPDIERTARIAARDIGDRR
jgi:hypothetical protein